MFKIKLDGGKTMEVEERTYWHTTSHILAQAVKRLSKNKINNRTSYRKWILL